MRRNFFLTAAAAISLATVSAGAALAGDWGSGCGYCGYGNNPVGGVYYAPPTYSYAPPTTTVLRHYVVQPNYIVQRTYVIRQNHYVNETGPCLFTCGLGRLFHHGPYYGGAALVAPAVGFEGYGRRVYPRHYRAHYVAPHRHYYGRRHYQRYHR